MTSTAHTVAQDLFRLSGASQFNITHLGLPSDTSLRLINVLRPLTKARLAWKEGKRSETLELQIDTLKLLFEMYRDYSEDGQVWLNGAFKVVLDDAVRVSQKTGSVIKDSENLLVVVRDEIWYRFPLIENINDSEAFDSSLMWLFVYIMCIVCKLYFRIGTPGLLMHQWKKFKLIYMKNRTAGGKSLFQDPVFRDPSTRLRDQGMANKVTMAFYLGRIAALEDRVEDAEHEFAFAYESIPVGHASKRRVFERLLPLRLVLGQCPSVRLMRHYNVTDKYVKLIDCTIRGDVGGVRQELIRHAQYFARLDACLILERLVLIAHRAVVRRELRGKNELDVANLPFVNDVGGGGSNEMLLDRNECIVQTLISSGLMRGYVAQNPSICRVDEKDPLPSLRKAKVTDWRRAYESRRSAFDWDG